MSAHSESALERECVVMALARGYEHRKLDVGSGSKGWLDRSFWGPNARHFIVEFKTATGRLSPKQTERIRRLSAMGHAVHVVRNVEEFEALL